MTRTNEDQLPDDVGATPVDQEDLTQKPALSGIDRRVTEEDLQHRGTQKLILDRLDTAEAAVKKLEGFQQDYYETREALAVAKAALERIQSLDILQSTMLGVGCLILGYLPATWTHWSETILVAVAGGALVAGCWFSKKRSVK